MKGRTPCQTRHAARIKVSRGRNKILRLMRERFLKMCSLKETSSGIASVYEMSRDSKGCGVHRNSGDGGVSNGGE